MDDRELVDGIMNKEEHALECLLDRYGGLLKAITAYHLGWIDYTEEIDLFPQLKREQK